MNATAHALCRLIISFSCLLLAACGGSGGEDVSSDDPPPPAASFSIGGNLSGLVGDGVLLRLQLNGTAVEDLAVVSDGVFTFTTQAAVQDAYRVEIAASPANPTQSCEFSSTGRAEGSVTGNVNDVNIQCRQGYTVSVDVSGLIGGGLVLLNTVTDDFAIDPSVYPRLDYLDVDEDGTVSFDVPLASGEDYAITVETPPSAPDQECSVENGSGSIFDQDVTNVTVTCERGIVGGTVTGLEGETIVLALDIDTEFNGARPLLDHETLNVSADGPFQFNAELEDGTWYRVSERTRPSPDEPPLCAVINAVGVIDGDVNNVRVECGEQATIGGTVRNLFGFDLELRLIRIESTVAGNVETVIEDLGIGSDGEYQFDATLRLGDSYRVEVTTQPNSPDQECLIENEAGELDDDVTDVDVDCGGPHRHFRFDDILTFDEEEGLEEGDLYFGELDARYTFTQRSSIPLGRVSGLDGTEFFQTRIDGPDVEGNAFSNENGYTYWMSAESGIASYFSTLNTRWLMRKESDDAELKLIVTRVNLLAYDAGHNEFVVEAGSLRAGADLRILALKPGPTEEDDEVFFHRQGEIELLGRRSEADPARTDWTLTPHFEPDALEELWSLGDFVLDAEAGVASVTAPERVAFAQLAQAIEVEIDLSSVNVNEVFELRAEGLVVARNNYSAEGGTVGFLRDPGGFDPGDPEFGAVAELTDIVVLPIDDEEEYPSGPSQWPQPDACSDPTAEPAQLRFASSDFLVSEDDETWPYRMINVWRDGGVDGVVEARIALEEGTATADEDFESGDIVVRFGDQSSAPRTVVLPIYNDAEPEDDETLTLRLHSVSGCAELGAIGEANVTIAANDPDRGRMAFTADAFEVAENAGFARVSVQRTGGTFSFVSGRIETADGTAIAGTDYATTSEFVVFSEGESGPVDIEVPIIDNLDIDGERTVLLSIVPSSPAEAGSPATAVLTIRDEDADRNGVLSFTDSSYVVGEADGTVAVSVQRNDGAVGDVTVTIATSDGTAVAGSDYDFVQSVATFPDGDADPRVLNIAITDDPDDEGDESFNVMLFDATGGAEIGVPAVVPVSIVDNDGPPPPPPPAPTLSVSAGSNELIFDWPSVVEATYFRLLADPDGLSGYAQVGNDIPLGEIGYALPVSVHLIDWVNARYLLQACNSSGCTDSNDVSVESLMLSSITFVKSSNSLGRRTSPTRSGHYFGWDVAISADGSTMVASSPNEASDATFVNGDQSNDDLVRAGAAYVFIRGATGWEQQAYIKASNTRSTMDFGTSLALSADGATLAVGAPNESSNATGIGGDAANILAGGSGAVYVYRRTGDSWLFDAYVKASNTGALDAFGTDVALSADGQTLVVGAPGESSDAVGIGGDQQNDLAEDAGAAYLFSRASGSWQQTAYIKASNAETGDAFGTAVAVSGDGAFVAVAARSEDSAATGINGDQTDNSAPGNGASATGTGAVYSFVLTGGVWQQSAYIKPSNTDADDRFGSALALNDDGSVLAVGANREDSSGTGINSTLENDNGTDGAGAVYLFNRDGPLWSQTAYVKASNPDRTNLFGDDVSLSADGTTLVVGASFEESRSQGVNGSQVQDGVLAVGAAYLFELDATTGVWSQRTYIKAPNADQNPDFPNFAREISFGFSLALSGDGNALAVGGYRESSDARGVGGDQINQNAQNAGAVYVY